jgi:hypothetical protein
MIGALMKWLSNLKEMQDEFPIDIHITKETL